jgi:15-cis-phytoene synthase
MDPLYNSTCIACSELITKRYSTSFSLGIRLFAPRFRPPIYAIYGFVRFADEIVDTFHTHDKQALLDRFKEETYRAIEEGISLNPVLHSFQEVVRKYNIELELIEAFLHSMEMDLYHTEYEEDLYEKYIYGSAEVVGLMCLRVFTEGDSDRYDALKEPARKLGAAFQKINFLRDIRSDYDVRSRVYFPGVDFERFTESDKRKIEADIKQDFDEALIGIRALPQGSKLGVYLAYVYYTSLFEKIKKAAPEQVLSSRIRVPDTQKIYFLCSSTVKNSLGLI